MSAFHAPIILRGKISDIRRFQSTEAAAYRAAVLAQSGKAATIGDQLVVIDVDEVMRGPTLDKQVFIRMNITEAARGPLLDRFVGSDAIYFVEPDLSIQTWEGRPVLHPSPTGIMHGAVYRHLAPETSACGGVASVNLWPIIAIGPLSEPESRVLSPDIRSTDINLNADFITSDELFAANEVHTIVFDCTMYAWSPFVDAMRERVKTTAPEPPVVLGAPGERPKGAF